MANNIWSNYTEKTSTPVDADEVMVRDSTDGKNKRLLFGTFWKWVAKKLNEATISELQTNNKTIIGAINALNSDKIKATTFKVSVNVTANKSYSTDISYQSISGEVLFSDVTWSNEKSDVPINVMQYRTGACTISSINHGWAIDQKVSFIVAVLYI